MTCVVNDRRWDSIPLEMSHQGVARFKVLTASVPRVPMVYAHVETETRQVLRIGKGVNGIHRRWTTDPNGHLSTFEWATKRRGPYRPYARKFPHYLLFFHLLHGMQTEVWFTAVDWAVIESEEKGFIKKYAPVWEQFLGLCNDRGVREDKPLGPAVSDCDFTNPSLPTLDGLQSTLLWPSCKKDD